MTQIDKLALIEWLEREMTYGGSNEYDQAFRWQLGEVIREIQTGKFDIKEEPPYDTPK